LRNQKLNSQLKIAFVVSASSSVGNGHLIRSLALADSLRNKGASCVFLNSTLSREATTMVISAHHEIETLSLEQPDLRSYMTEYQSKIEQGASTRVRSHNKHKPFDVVIFDSYNIDKVIEDRLKIVTEYRVVIDDLANRPHSCEMIIDQTPIHETSDYLHLTQSSTTLLIGPEFTLLKPEFAAMRKKIVSRKPGILNVLIAFGAFDQDRLILKTLNLLRNRREFKDKTFHIMLSSHSRQLNDLRFLALDSPSNINLHIDSEKAYDLMSEMDLAITAGGLTSLELACLGVNTIVLPASTIQAEVAYELSKQCNFQVIPNWRDEFETSLLNCVNQSISSINNGEDRQLHQKIDGLGTKRVTDIILHCVQEARAVK
jgi:UDP-2,4-diacetamido-2,4,6-trideoxy-beta-L-altropyranose hydrolase